MRRFVRNILLVFLAFVLFNGVLFLFAHYKYYKPYSLALNKNFNKVLFADSHGLPLKQFAKKEGVFNLAASSDSYFDMFIKLNYLIENDFKIDTVYITVDDHTLSKYRESLNNLDRSVVYTKGSDYDDFYVYLKKRYIRYYFPVFQPKVRILFSKFLVSKISSIFSNNEDRNIDRNWSELSWDEQIKGSKTRLKEQFSSIEISESLKKELNKIIATCKKNNIELIGVKFPLSSSYCEVLGERNYGADSILISSGYSISNNKRMFLENDSFFYDQDHMNDKGGIEFVNRVFRN